MVMFHSDVSLPEATFSHERCHFGIYGYTSFLGKTSQQNVVSPAPGWNHQSRAADLSNIVLTLVWCDNHQLFPRWRRVPEPFYCLIVIGKWHPADPRSRNRWIGMFYRSTAKKSTQVEAKVLASTSVKWAQQCMALVHGHIPRFPNDIFLRL
jgi:hypothetical protein